jgi:hypothetical protein
MIFFKSGWFSFFAIIIPLINGIVVAYLSHLITDDIGNRFILQSSLRVSYIAVPAAMKIAQKQILNFAYGTSYYLPFNITFECLYTFP